MGDNTFHRNQSGSGIDAGVVAPLLVLGFIGFFLLLTTNQTLAWQQAGYLVVGLGVLVVLSRLDPVVLWWFAPYGYVLSLLFLITSFFFPPIRGATRWIVIGSVQLQPSELIKPFLLLAFARAIATFSPRQVRHLPVLVATFLLPALLVFRQPDLGTSIVYTAAWLAMMVAGGLSLILLTGAVGLFSISSPLIWRLFAAYQKARILTFLNPGLDPQGAGYNALQAMIAVGSGQLFGRGLGRGTQSHLRFLPEFHTDFIFATLVEELGFIGGLTLLFLYGILLWRILAPFLKGLAEELFLFLYSIGLLIMISTQVTINAGMNMGIIPVTGITLPFVSYGGSSILSLSSAFGILLALRKRERGESIAIV